ncbi:Zinc finger MYM-type protein [Ooceraea biroi]|uniref:Zinc finger MYM-type protein n=1 Tax=Ooceraea biroi TaxID=2015173 RepID=A0A026VV26_OOCBI|nr:Zinc finger MYM-type protein [Ooceraea biroi]
MNNVNIKTQKTIVSMCNVQYKKHEKERDLKIAAFIASHTSIRSIDHLSNILKSSYPQSKDFQMHRTKCSNLITNVIAPNMLTNLIEDIGDMEYSMIVDESTDVVTCKYLCLCIKYFSHPQNRIVTKYLGKIEIEHADSNSLHSAVIEYSKDIGLNLSKMIGLGTDGGSNLCGKKHSLFTLLRSENSDLQLVRCVCHALNNAASAAAEEFPASIEFLCREVHNWFNNSSVRRSTYKLTWDTMNKSDESNKNDSQKDLHKFVKLSSTRWLSRFNVVRVILEHYLELILVWLLILKNAIPPRLLCQMLQDNSNFLYLTIIKPILYEVNDVNLAFQRENVDLGLAYDDLKHLIILLARKIMKPSFFNRFKGKYA